MRTPAKNPVTTQTNNCNTAPQKGKTLLITDSQEGRTITKRLYFRT